MGPYDPLQPFSLHQVVNRPLSKVDRAGTFIVEAEVGATSVLIFVRVRPEQVCKHVFTLGLSLSVNAVNAGKTGQLNGDTSMHAEVLSVDAASQREQVEQFHAPFVHF